MAMWPRQIDLNGNGGVHTQDVDPPIGIFAHPIGAITLRSVSGMLALSASL